MNKDKFRRLLLIELTNRFGLEHANTIIDILNRCFVESE